MPFGSEQWMYASGGFYPYEIDQSLRFNDDDSAYLSRTPASAGNRKTWTWSGWIKDCSTVFQGVFGASDGTNYGDIYIGFPANVGEISFDFYGAGARSLTYSTSLHRDPSAWYHLVVAVDTTQATDSNRVKVYLNGSEIFLENTSSGSRWPSLNAEGGVNTTSAHFLGARSTGSTHFDGYMAEVNFVDGQALDPTDFGEFKSGVWVPKRYSGTYGTNGFHLDFGNSGSLGADSSGNGNNWTSNNLAATDQVLDSPTNNFCTMNPLRVGSHLALLDGNLKLAATLTGAKMVSSTFGVTAGKWYWESVIINPQQSLIGVENGLGSSAEYVGQSVNGWSYDMYTGNLYNSGSVSYGDTFTTNDVIGIAVDMDSGKLWFSKNGTWQNSGSPTAGTNPAATNLAGTIFPAFTPYNQYAASVVNFGQDSSFAGNKTAQGNTDANGIGDFYYAPPAGYLALCTANLPDPAIDPAQDDVPTDYFNTVLYTGNGSTQSITGVGFQPDWVWLKCRSIGYDHGLVDSVRGVTKFLESNTLDAESTVANYTTSFDSDGFSLGVNNRFNQSSATNVAWNWLAGGSGVTNTDGTITSTVSANQKAGFSIVTWTNPATVNQTIGHGLGVKPDVIIRKYRSNADGWPVYHESLGQTNYLQLNSTNASSADANVWPGTIDSTVFSTGQLAYFPSGWTAVAYCFHSVEGYSKFGSYTGNGSTDGPFVYTGFRPAFIMLKSSTRDASWIIIDAERDQENVASKRLLANLSNAESSGVHNIDFLSNGFKMRGDNNNSNGSGETYIYMAFAEMPFKYSNAR